MTFAVSEKGTITKLFYFHVPLQMSKIKQGKKISGLGIWTIEWFFLQKLSAGSVFYIYSRIL